MSDKVTTEIAYKVWDDNEGVALEVGPFADGGDWITIKPTDNKSESFYGKVDLSLPAEVAKQLGHALIKCAEDVKDRQ